jgi:hypothetical protein
MASDLDMLIGAWNVRVLNWVWRYEFNHNNTVVWKDTRSAERGSGTWSESAGAIILAWEDSQTRENWNRPISAANTRATYKSSYFNGLYKVEKAETKFELTQPPQILQKYLYCWAAGASSWRRARGRGTETVEQLIERFGGYLNNDGTMPESEPDSPDAKRGGIKEVFNQLGIRVFLVNVKDLNYEYFYNLLKTNAHFLLMSGGTSMGHTRVVYGVGDPSPDYFKVFDPLRGYQTIQFSAIAGGQAYIGVAK